MESEWLGKLWARWGDAVREAGFTPNQLNHAYDKTELLEKYAKLALELGRLPTANDLRLKHRKDSFYPDQKVFERLGKKAELIRQVLEFCQNHEGYGDVIRMCEAYATLNHIPPEKATLSEEKTGFVYLVKSNRFYKIGKTNAVGRREYELAIQLPEPTRTVHVIRTDDPTGIEAYWHNRFANKRKNGEWFELDATDVAIFKRRKFM